MEVCYGMDNDMRRLKLPSGIDYCEDANGKRVSRGAMMGRPDTIPDGLLQSGKSIKLQLELLRWVDSDYDQGGAYWGRGSWENFTNIYCAWGKWGVSHVLVQVFARAHNRMEAKQLVREQLPKATFYR